MTGEDGTFDIGHLSSHCYQRDANDAKAELVRQVECCIHCSPKSDFVPAKSTEIAHECN